MATRTVGFAIDEADEPRLRHLVDKYGGGNRSAFLRMAISYMEAAERADRLRAIQAYGARRAAERGTAPQDVTEMVHKVLARRAKAKRCRASQG